MAHLSKYMSDRDLSDEDVAAEIGCTRVTISRIRRKMVRPDWSTIGKLKVWSGGLITADDFQEMPEVDEARA